MSLLNFSPIKHSYTVVCKPPTDCNHQEKLNARFLGVNPSELARAEHNFIAKQENRKVEP